VARLRGQPRRMGDESEPKTRVWELNWPFQELGDEIDPRPRVGGRKWLFCLLLSGMKALLLKDLGFNGLK
jgi:hypothetical protein